MLASRTLKTFLRGTHRLYTTKAAAAGAADIAKRRAGYEAVDRELLPLTNSGKATVVGLGSGTTIESAMERISQISPKRFIFIPTSFQTKRLIIQSKLHLGSLDQYPHIDLTIDGADEVDKELNCIKGGGACLFQEMLIARASKRFVIIADTRKQSSQLGTKMGARAVPNWLRGIPVEVIPMAAGFVQEALQSQFPDAIINLRMATPTDKAGPVVTDQGNLVLDCHMGPLTDPVSLYQQIKRVTGVVEVGLFCNLADKAYFGRVDSEGIDIWE